MSKETDVMDIDDNIMELFNLPGTTPAVIEEDKEDEDIAVPQYPVAPSKDVPVPREQRRTQAQTDYDFSRRTLHNTIEKGSKSLEDLVYFAANSGGPEAFKQVGALMDSISRSTKQLLELQSQMDKTEGMGKVGGTGNQKAQTINNNTTIVDASGSESAYEGLTREEALAKRKMERQARAAQNAEKVVN